MKLKSQVMKEREKLHQKTDKGGVNCLLSLWRKESKPQFKSLCAVSMVIEKPRMWLVDLKLQLPMWLVDLNYNFECDWLIKLSDNNLASELVTNRSFLNQSQSTNV